MQFFHRAETIFAYTHLGSVAAETLWTEVIMARRF